jgi:23S rRNA pseudouridine1911/1915/1917 synthase
MLEEHVFGAPSVRFRVDRPTSGLRLSRCVANQLADLSVRAAKDLIDRGRVFVNNQRITKASAPVQEGEWIEVYPHDGSKRVRLHEEDILWEGKALVAVNKPPGLLVYGTQGVTEDTVLPQLEGLLKKTGRWRPRRDNPMLVHRLDRDTSGLLLVARDEKSASALERQFKQKIVEKRYLALARGRPAKERFRQISEVTAKRPAHGSKDHRTSKTPATAQKSSHGPKGETEFEVLETFAMCALIEARPLTGRTHQIRVHLAQVGHPVLGDIVYGPEKCAERLFRAIPRQMLHASFLGVDDPDEGARLELTAPLLDDMNQVLTWLKRGFPSPSGRGSG